jgi:hypothetical protein
MVGILRFIAPWSPGPPPAADQALPLWRTAQAAAVRSKRGAVHVAVEALPFESPKLSATAVLSPEDFASRSERAIMRSGVRPTQMIEAETLPQPE